MKVVISPPFGQRMKVSWATSISGSYTILHRPGLIKQAIKTIRKTKAGWVNKMGLRNPGLLSHPKKLDTKKIVSFVALDVHDWDIFLNIVPPAYMVEINLGCPNISEHAAALPSVLASFVDKYKFVSVKLPGIFNQALEHFEVAYINGVRIFHICNTIPVPQGGLSGREIMKVSIPVINTIRSEGFEDVTIIGGGGIYTPEDVQRYKDAGADIFSLSTIWFTPWKVPAVKREIFRL